MKIKSGGLKEEVSSAQSIQQPEESSNPILRNIKSLARNTFDLAEDVRSSPFTDPIGHLVGKLGELGIRGYEYLSGNKTGIPEFIKEFENNAPAFKTSNILEGLGVIGKREEPQNIGEEILQRGGPQLLYAGLTGGIGSLGQLGQAAARTGLGATTATGLKEAGAPEWLQNVGDFGTQALTSAYQAGVTPGSLRKSAKNIASRASELRKTAGERVGKVPVKDLRNKFDNAIKVLETDEAKHLVEPLRKDIQDIDTLLKSDKVNLRELMGKEKALNDLKYSKDIEPKTKAIVEKLLKPVREFIIEQGEKNPDLEFLDFMHRDLHTGLKKQTGFHKFVSSKLKDMHPATAALMGSLLGGGGLLTSLTNPKNLTALALPGGAFYANKAYDLLSGSKILRKIFLKGIKDAANQSKNALVFDAKKMDNEVNKLLKKESPQGSLKIKSGGLK